MALPLAPDAQTGQTGQQQLAHGVSFEVALARIFLGNGNPTR